MEGMKFHFSPSPLQEQKFQRPDNPPGSSSGIPGTGVGILGREAVPGALRALKWDGGNQIPKFWDGRQFQTIPGALRALK